ncbi:MAG: SPFH domain-containing protein [Streptococcaceae bacterium]|jgi:regulator of protease activity HflC (stomatin/prohibitin superfamily)|nr:SPFH domain-containing protein [Streptococcaceae bacterium]
MGALITLLVVLLIIVIVVIASISSLFFVVKQQTVAVVERFGKFSSLANPGFHVKAPWGIDRIAARIQLRMIQSDMVVETKSNDNVFVTMNISTQYRVNEQNIMDAYYKLMHPGEQIKAYIEDALRSAVPKLSLDDLFEKKDEIALEVQKQVAEEMTTYGYIIVKTLITRVEPDAEVKQSMNEINAAQRKQDAAQMLANASKIQVVTAAEAEAEKDRLHGVGLAEQRKAIVDGLAQQIGEMKSTGIGLSEETIMSILLINQYLDTLNQFAGKGNATLFLPAGAEGIEDLRTQLLSALKANKQ